MLVLSTDTLPDNLKIKEAHGFLETTFPVEISSKGLLRNVFEKNRMSITRHTTCLLSQLATGEILSTE